MRQGFTLIELLVVITIIVVLLALLTPALDRAIYQAELAACGAHQKGINSGINVYAAAHRRWYPERKAITQTNGGAPDMIKEGNIAFRNTIWDDRPIINNYVNFKSYNDPLLDEVGLSIGEDHEATTIIGGYNRWYGWKYNVEGFSSSGLNKLGDRLGFDGKRYTVLIGDDDAFASDEALLTNSHPDADGVMALLTLENEGFQGVTEHAAGLGLGDDTIQQTTSRWYADGNWRRGPTDHNYSFTDGSVARYNRVLIEDPSNNDEPDERMGLVPQNQNGPEIAEGAFGTWWILLPLR